MKVMTVILGLALSLAAAAAAQDRPAGLTVVGEGRVAMTPDVALVRMGVTAEADSAGAAAAALSDRLGPVLEALAEAGIAPADIRTGTLQLGPIHAGRGPGGEGRPEIVGYRAESLVEVRLQQVGRVGEILDAAIETGTNRLEGIAFSASQPEVAESAALAAAVADALRKAQVVSQAAGLTLGPVRSITEQGGGMPRPEMMRMSAADMPVAPGEIEATARVEVVYDLAE